MSTTPASTADETPPGFRERRPSASACYVASCSVEEHLRDVPHPQRGWVTACSSHGWAVRQLHEDGQEPRARVARSGVRDALSPTLGGRATPTVENAESRDDDSKTGVAHGPSACHAKGQLVTDGGTKTSGSEWEVLPGTTLCERPCSTTIATRVSGNSPLKSRTTTGPTSFDDAPTAAARRRRSRIDAVPIANPLRENDRDDWLTATEKWLGHLESAGGRHRTLVPRTVNNGVPGSGIHGRSSDFISPDLGGTARSLHTGRDRQEGRDG